MVIVVMESVADQRPACMNHRAKSRLIHDRDLRVPSSASATLNTALMSVLFQVALAVAQRPGHGIRM